MTTPRSGRSKKKSTLSRLAARPQDSDEEVSTSQRYGNHHSYGYDDDEEERGRSRTPKQTRFRYDEDDEEETRATRYGSSRGRVVESEEESEESDSRGRSRYYKGVNSRRRDDDSDEENLRNNGYSRSTNDRHHNKQYIDSDEDVTGPDFNTSSPMKRLTYNQTRDDIAATYQDALDRIEREEPSDEDDELSHLPPRRSARSPDRDREYHRRPTDMSMASTMSSRNFRNHTAIAHQEDDMFGAVSQASNASSSLLPLLSTKEARNRSFLVGTITGSGSLLGAEELERYFPDRKLRVFLGTWNMCELKPLPDSLDDFLLPETCEYVHDMYVIGTQESCSNRRDWEVSLQKTLGPQHLLVHTASHGVLYLCVFLRRDLIWYSSVCEEAAVTTRPGPVSIKTKGAIGVSLSLFGTSFLFINSHLSPHDGHIKDRIADYAKICAGLQLPKQSSTHQEADVTARFDCVFWLGDLNFRIEKARDQVDHLMEGINTTNESRDYEELVVHDELNRARNEGQAFQDFQEGRIKFKPSYKYDIGTDNYDSSKKMRIPSYTDRILVRTKKKNSANCLHYDCAYEVRASDHKPVYAVYEVDLRPGRENIPLSAGFFKKDIWLEANRRRAVRLEMEKVVKSQKNSSICSIQ